MWRMSTQKPDLSAAYALETPDDNRKLYAEWAGTYDAEFAQNMNYVLPQRVAEAYGQAGGGGPVLDVGAGTGLVGVTLVQMGIGPCDATDIAPEMLAVAARKGVYARLFEADLLDRLPCDDNHYGGAVSAGTFTTGHVGPKALDEVLRVVRPGGTIVLSINAAHFRAAGFAKAFDARRPLLSDLTFHDVRIYAPGAMGDHCDDLGRICVLKKA